MRLITLLVKMMSKERELLEQCRMYLSSLGMFVEHSTLINGIDELLTQPEQTEQTEQEDIRDVWQDGYEAGLRLAKREPLSAETIAELWWNTYVVGKADSVRNFARAIEKAHGITGGE